jgi:hypothetical protein
MVGDPIQIWIWMGQSLTVVVLFGVFTGQLTKNIKKIVAVPGWL